MYLIWEERVITREVIIKGVIREIIWWCLYVVGDYLAWYQWPSPLLVKGGDALFLKAKLITYDLYIEFL